MSFCEIGEIVDSYSWDFELLQVYSLVWEEEVQEEVGFVLLNLLMIVVLVAVVNSLYSKRI